MLISISLYNEQLPIGVIIEYSFIMKLLLIKYSILLKITININKNDFNYYRTNFNFNIPSQTRT